MKFGYAMFGDDMDKIDVRGYIINNFRGDNVEEIANSINISIDSKEDDPLVGLGVLFEIMWKNSNEKEKNFILSNIKKGLK